jgi:hypothetical protein
MMTVSMTAAETVGCRNVLGTYVGGFILNLNNWRGA